MRHPLGALAVSAVFGAFLAADAAAQPAPPPSRSDRCFYVNQFENWKAPDDKTIYIRVNLNRYYRLDLSTACPTLKWPDAHLIMNVRGPDTICSAVDWDLKVNQPGSIPEPCIVKNMTFLTPAEVAKIPNKYKP